MGKFMSRKWEASPYGTVFAEGKTIALANSYDDARLIAAAPEMYEALEQALYILNRYDPDNSVVEVIRRLLTRIDRPQDAET